MREALPHWRYHRLTQRYYRQCEHQLGKGPVKPYPFASFWIYTINRTPWTRSRVRLCFEIRVELDSFFSKVSFLPLWGWFLS